MAAVLEPQPETADVDAGLASSRVAPHLDDVDNDGRGGPRLKPEAPPSAKATKQRTSPWYYVVLLVVALAFLAICYFVLFSGSSRTNVPVGTGTTATTARKTEDAATTADKAITELKQVVAQPTPAVLAQSAPADPLAQPVAPPNSIYAPNPYSMNQPVAAPADPNAQPASANGDAARASSNTTGAGAGGGKAEKERPDATPAPPAHAASAQTSYYVFNRDGESTARPDLRALPVVSTRGDAGGDSPTKPPFNTVLNVRLLGKLYSFRNGALARFITTQPASGPGWSMPRGTLIIGRLQGVQNNRVYVKVDGFVDRSNRLVTMGGELLDREETEGLEGKRVRVGSAWKKFFAQLANAGVQLGTARIGQGGGVIVASQQQGRDIFSSSSSASPANADFVVVPAGVTAKIFVSDTPPRVEGVQPSGVEAQEGFLSDEELATLLATGTPEQIRQALPRMRPELRAVAEELLNAAPPQQ